MGGIADTTNGKDSIYNEWEGCRNALYPCTLFFQHECFSKEERGRILISISEHETNRAKFWFVMFIKGNYFDIRLYEPIGQPGLSAPAEARGFD